MRTPSTYRIVSRISYCLGDVRAIVGRPIYRLTPDAFQGGLINRRDPHLIGHVAVDRIHPYLRAALLEHRLHPAANRVVFDHLDLHDHPVLTGPGRDR